MKAYGVTIQMKLLWKIFCLVLFISLGFYKKKLISEVFVVVGIKKG